MTSQNNCIPRNVRNPIKINSYFILLYTRGCVSLVTNTIFAYQKGMIELLIFTCMLTKCLGSRSWRVKWIRFSIGPEKSPTVWYDVLVVIYDCPAGLIPFESLSVKTMMLLYVVWLRATPNFEACLRVGFHSRGLKLVTPCRLQTVRH